jgi:hypothetical protein
MNVIAIGAADSRSTSKQARAVERRVCACAAVLSHPHVQKALITQLSLLSFPSSAL